jgi:hypothetical protein
MNRWSAKARFNLAVPIVNIFQRVGSFSKITDYARYRIEMPSQTTYIYKDIYASEIRLQSNFGSVTTTVVMHMHTIRLNFLSWVF